MMTENVIYDTHNDNNNNNDNKKHAYAGTNDYFTHLRALFGTPSTAAFWPTQLALLGIIPPAVIHMLHFKTLPLNPHSHSSVNALDVPLLGSNLQQ